MAENVAPAEPLLDPLQPEMRGATVRTLVVAVLDDLDRGDGVALNVVARSRRQNQADPTSSSCSRPAAHNARRCRGRGPSRRLGSGRTRFDVVGPGVPLDGNGSG